MRHRNKGRKLGVTQSHRQRLLQQLVNSLFQHERIITTVARAKEARRMAEKMITLAKKASPALLARYRLALSRLQDKDLAVEVIAEIHTGGAGSMSEVRNAAGRTGCRKV